MNIILKNLLIWVIVASIVSLNVRIEPDPGESLVYMRTTVTLFLLYIIVVPVYFHNLVTANFLRRKKWLISLVLFLGMNALLATLWPLVAPFIDMLGRYLVQEEVDQSIPSLGAWYNVFGLYMFVSLMGISFPLARQALVRQQKQREAELSTLKNQLNPHFLFNSLNNLYGLSVTKSDKLPGLMLKLSDLLRYSLYETQTERVPLHKEVAYLENFVELERIRLEDSAQISFQVTGDVKDKQVAPLLLIPFVENAFKHHGAARGAASTIAIRLSVAEKSLTLDCHNSVDPAGTRTDATLQAGGIGTEITRKRLSLLYPKEHTLQVTEEPESYRVQLTLPL